jgi:hypothetical protein
VPVGELYKAIRYPSGGIIGRHETKTDREAARRLNAENLSETGEDAVRITSRRKLLNIPLKAQRQLPYVEE